MNDFRIPDFNETIGGWTTYIKFKVNLPKVILAILSLFIDSYFYDLGLHICLISFIYSFICVIILEILISTFLMMLKYKEYNALISILIILFFSFMFGFGGGVGATFGYWCTRITVIFRRDWFFN